MPTCNIISKIHGSDTWKRLVDEDCVNVFVGKYFDPYLDIIIEKLEQNFMEIVEYKRKHRKNTVLLYGNHDIDGWRWGRKKEQLEDPKVLADAIGAKAYLTVSGSERPKAELGEGEGPFSFTFTVHNLTAQALSYRADVLALSRGISGECFDNLSADYAGSGVDVALNGADGAVNPMAATAGIGEALVTTAAGLVASLILLFPYNILDSIRED